MNRLRSGYRDLILFRSSPSASLLKFNFVNPLLLYQTPSSMYSSAKPPNVLIVSKNDDEFDKCKTALSLLGVTDNYCLYRLCSSMFNQPWKINCHLLILASLDEVDRFPTQDEVLDYLNSGGAVLSCATYDFNGGISNAVNESQNASSESVKVLEYLNGGKAVITRLPLFDSSVGDSNSTIKSNLAFLLTQQFGFRLRREGSATPKWTPIFVFASDEKNRRSFFEILQRVEERGKLKNLKLHRADDAADDEDDAAVPISVSSTTSSHFFNQEIFFRSLRTNHLARVVLIAEILPTTMTILDDVLDDLPDNLGAIVIALQQSSGLGRGGNAWLSPLGCAMFTFNLRLSSRSFLGRHAPIIQHLAGLAIVEAVDSFPRFEKVDVKLKWPNDLVHGPSLIKLGGILAKTSIAGDRIHCSVGCGINLSNRTPTTCLEALAPEGKNVSMEELVATVMTKFERIVDDFDAGESERGRVLERYLRNWIHGDQVVTVKDDRGKKTVRIIGIDDYGFLLGSDETGDRVSLHPDGNSFDMLSNLIIPK